MGEACEAGLLNNASFLGLKRVGVRQKHWLRVEVQHQEKPESSALDASPFAPGEVTEEHVGGGREKRSRKSQDTRCCGVSQHADRQLDRCLPAPICQQLGPRALAWIC